MAPLRIRRHAAFLTTLLLGALAALPLFANSGFLSTRGGGDSPFLLLRLHQLLAGLQGGQFPVRWMPDADFGYGYPFFNYYAASPFYLAALLKGYGFSFVFSLKLTQLAALLAAAAGMYAWTRSVGLGRGPAWLAAAAYTFNPFHLVNLYVRGDSLSELWAMSLYPAALWTAQRCLDRPGLWRAFGLAAAVGLLALTHNISALNFMPFLLLYIALGAWGRSGAPPPSSGQTLRARWLPLAACLGAVAWGLGLAAFFWLPALYDIQSVQIADVTQGYFFFGNHFRGADLIQPSAFFNYEPVDGLPTPFSLGLIPAAFTLAGLAAMLWRAVRTREWAWLGTFLVLGLGLSTWMITPLSAWAWENLPLVRFTQFPWRFLSIQAVFAAPLIAQLARPWPARTSSESSPWPRAAGLALALAFFSLGGLRPDFVPVADADVTAERLNLYETFTGNIGSTIGFEYLPRAVQPRPFSSENVLERTPRLKVLAGQAAGARHWKRGAAEQWVIDVVAGPAAVAVPTHYWPGWAAETSDGRPLEVRPAPSLGWIAFDLEPGRHEVTLRLGSTPVRSLSGLVSLLALAAPLGVLAMGRRRAGWTRPSFGDLRLWAWRIGILILGAIALRAWPGAPASALPLSMDFIQLAYPHHDVIQFGDGARLVRVDYSASRLVPGAALTVQTAWDAAQPLDYTLSLVSPANLLLPVPAALASASGPAAGRSDLTLVIPDRIPPGIYFVTLDYAGGPALTSSGRERGRVHLAPVWLDDPSRTAQASSQPPLASEALVEITGAAASQAAPGVLQIEILWRALGDVPRNYPLALRLRDAAGTEWAALDSQTGGGYYPTHFWRAGEAVPDSYALPLPAGTPPGEYRLLVSLYDPLSLETLIEATVTAAVSLATPAGDTQAQFQLSPEIGLAGVDFPGQFTQGEAPELKARWITTARPPAYRVRWALSGPAGEALAHVVDLAPGSPTSAWPAGALVLGRVRFGTPPSLAPGEYDLSAQLLDAQDRPVGPPVIAGQVRVLGRPRAYSLPAMEVEVGATFGGKLKLWGYSSEQSAESLSLTLHWGALAEPGADYKFFVHLFNPADGFVAAQVDAMPHDFNYPTALWAAGEVVTDVVRLPLAGLAPGTYGVAAGWYDPASPALERLPALDSQGRPLEADRVILPLIVSVP